MTAPPGYARARRAAGSTFVVLTAGLWAACDSPGDGPPAGGSTPAEGPPIGGLAPEEGAAMRDAGYDAAGPRDTISVDGAMRWRLSVEPLVRRPLGPSDARGRPPVLGAVLLPDSAILALRPGGTLVRLGGARPDTVRLPDDLQEADWIGPAPGGDGAAIFDRRSGRAALLAVDGTVRERATLTGPPGAPQPILVGTLGDGAWVATAIAPESPRTPGPARDPVLLLRYPVDGGAPTVLDTLPGFEAWVFQAEEVLDLALVPFGGFPVAAARDGAVAAGVSETGDLLRWDANGRLRWRVSLDLPRVALDSTHFADLLERRLRDDRRGARTETASGTFAALPHPARAPAFDRLLLDDAGGTWVRRFRLDDGPTEWVALDAMGVNPAALPVPATVRVLDIDRGRVLGLWEEGGEWEVRAYTIVRPAHGR